ncbi:MAG TPA: hypothetical protein VJG83_04270 [archaeon]|nr:hypothetical protein [archaeon]
MAKSHGKIGIPFFLRFISPKTYLVDRSHRVFERYKKTLESVGISQISSKEHIKDFLAGFKARKIGNYATSFTKGVGESPLRFSIVKRWSRKTVYTSSFILTPKIEGQPLRGLQGFDLAILSLQGPSPRKFDSKKAVSDAKQALKEPGQNFLLRELVQLGAEKGAGRIVMLRPEYNPYLDRGFLLSKGLTDEEIDSLKSQYYAAAQKCGFKKKSGSKYLWHASVPQ